MMQNRHGICWPKDTPPTHRSMKYQLMVEFHQFKQELRQSTNDHYNQIRFIWDQIDLSGPTWACSKDAQ